MSDFQGGQFQVKPTSLATEDKHKELAKKLNEIPVTKAPREVKVFLVYHCGCGSSDTFPVTLSVSGDSPIQDGDTIPNLDHSSILEVIS